MTSNCLPWLRIYINLQIYTDVRAIGCLVMKVATENGLQPQSVSAFQICKAISHPTKPRRPYCYHSFPFLSDTTTTIYFSSTVTCRPHFHFHNHNRYPPSQQPPNPILTPNTSNLNSTSSIWTAPRNPPPCTPSLRASRPRPKST
jgi:hypothetical protein